MPKLIPITLDDRYWIPAKHVDLDKAEDLYRIQIFDEKACARCEYKPDRVCDVCLECEAFKGDYKLYQKAEINDKKHIGVPIGNTKKLKRLLGKNYKQHFKIIDIRNEGKSFRKLGLKFYKKNLYKYQKKVERKLNEVDHGILKSAPRTGKTVMAANLVLDLQVKTLILAHQEDLIKQFIGTFYSEDPQFTNIADKEKFDGRQYVKWCKTYEDFKKHPICLATYQTFLSKGGRKMLMKVRDLPFGLLLVDEVHRAGAAGYASVVNNMRAKRRIGLTATPKRKDGLHCLPYDAIVSTDTGDAKIGDVVTGIHKAEYALCFNHETGQQEYSKITARHKNGIRNDFVMITHELGTLMCTTDHEVWSVSRMKYVAAGSLRAGELVEVSD